MTDTDSLFYDLEKFVEICILNKMHEDYKQQMLADQERIQQIEEQVFDATHNNHHHHNHHHQHHQQHNLNGNSTNNTSNNNEEIQEISTNKES